MKSWLELQGTAGLITRLCAGLALALFLVLFVWLLSGELQAITALGGGVFILLLAGITRLAKAGRARLASRLLVGLLFLFAALDAAAYGIGTLAAMAFTLPVVLAARALGMRSGLLAALASALVIWLVAWAATSGWYIPLAPVEPSHLTFYAPVATVILLLLAWMAGWGDKAN